MSNPTKFLAIFLVVVLAIGCKKENLSPASVVDDPEDVCVTAESVNSGEVISGQYIVSYNNSISNRATSTAQIAEISTDVVRRHSITKDAVRGTFAGEMNGFVARLSKQEALALQADPAVETIEPDRVIKLSTCFTVAAPTLVTWNVTRVGYGNGVGKRAWIIDSGIDFNHPDLTVNTTLSKSFIASETSASDENGHGTHVAGIIGAKNNEFGVLGVASGAELISLKVLNKEGSGSLSAIIQALSYINANGVAGDVVNMSFGLDTTSALLNQQIKNTAAKGIFITIAAGNDHKAAKDYSPANTNATNVYTVSAIDSLDNFASFSNFGNDCVDYAQPGVRILSTYPGNKYAYMNGTSMAAPHLAGLLLLRKTNIKVSGYAKNDPDGTPDAIAHY